MVNQVMTYLYRVWMAKKEENTHEFDTEIKKDSNFLIDNSNFDMNA